MNPKLFKYYIILIFFISLPISSQNDINLKHLTPRYKNKDVPVFRTAQDSLGIVWMTTTKEVLKYNGYSYQSVGIEEIFPEVDEKDRLSDLMADAHKNIWILSNQGLLSKYNSKTGAFENFSNVFKEPLSLFKPKDKETWAISKTGNILLYKNNEVKILATIPNLDGIHRIAESIEFVNDENIYISTSKGKVYNYSIKTKSLKELIGPFTNYPTSIILEADNNNKLWVGTETFGLLVYDITKQKFVHDSLFKTSLNDLSKEFFLTLFLDSKDNIWGGTDGDGLYKINTKTGETKAYRKDNINAFSLSSNTIININEDNKQNIWAVTKYGNINVIPKLNEHVKYHKGSANNIPLKVLSVYKSKKNDLWIGLDGNGATKVDTHGKTEHFFNGADNGFYVQSITEDHNNNIWLGTYKNGLWIQNSNSKTFAKIDVINELQQKATDIRVVFTDTKGRVWVGSNIAVNVYSSTKKLIASFDYDSNGLDGSILERVVEDSEQNIWLGVYGGGLFRCNENTDFKTSSFTKFQTSPESPISRIISMSHGQQNEIWIVTGDGNLLLFDTKDETFKNYNHLKSLQTEALQSIVLSDPYNLWLGSSNGLHHYNRKTNFKRTFYTTDGFQSNSYMRGSSYKDNDGLLYFGTKEGLNYFSPHSLVKEKSNALLSINDIQILNKPAKHLLSDQIVTDVFNLEQLKLEHNQSSFSIHFSAIDNILNPSYQYNYKLNGFDNDWITTYTEGSATYTNVPPGKYTFEIKANEINEQAVISKKAISIIITPPFWATPWAYMLYIALFGLLIYGFVKWYHLKKKLLINKISRRKENELHESKMTFFAKMSHEIQTPITLILGPLEDMITRSKQNGNMLLSERLNIISHNTKRLSRIAKELTLVRNKELNKLELSISQNNLLHHINEIALSFKELARNKKIDFNVKCPNHLTKTWYDADKLEHILYNLLSNAFKHTPKNGDIQLTVTPLKSDSYVKIAIKDSGSGIKKDELNDIFKMFYRSNTKTQGMGIGLALTKELVKLHKGKIKVNSSAEDGTTFSIKFPISEKNYEGHEKIMTSEADQPETLLETEKVKIKEHVDHDNNKKIILIVEDNFELQHFLKELLQEYFIILLAENGEEGFYHAKNNVPDLIISDIMMPEMDGIEMCKELNKNGLTKHIPVILLTAKNSTKSKIEGLKTGAIEYINKPFNTKELLLKIDNILTSRENIISKYRKELINKPDIKINKSQDEEFLEKLVSSINERLKDPNLKVEELAETLNTSYSTLYRKCQALTGHSSIDFIRMLRLKKAAILLSKYGYPISEVAYMVGFNDPKYFSKSFKNQFKTTPKTFKQKALEKNDIEQYLKAHNIDLTD